MTMKHNTERTTRYTYADCLRDSVPTPTGANGTTLYGLLMVGGTVVLMTTANGIQESGTDFLEQPH